MADIPLPDAGRGGDARAHGNRPAAPVRKIIRVKARRICPLAGWLARQRFDPAPLRLQRGTGGSFNSPTPWLVYCNMQVVFSTDGRRGRPS